MKKNRLSLFSPCYRKSYYLTHPWKFARDIYWSIRNFFHRGRYGYAYSDVWEWYTWWTTAGAEALRYLAKNGCGYPGYAPWETKSKWEAYLLELADKLDWCVKSCDIGGHEDVNEYQKLYDEIQATKAEKGKDARGYYFSRLNCTKEEEELIRKYWDREEELSQEDDKKREKIFAEIGKNLGRFWD